MPKCMPSMAKSTTWLLVNVAVIKITIIESPFRHQCIFLGCGHGRSHHSSNRTMPENCVLQVPTRLSMSFWYILKWQLCCGYLCWYIMLLLIHRYICSPHASQPLYPASDCEEMGEGGLSHILSKDPWCSLSPLGCGMHTLRVCGRC